MCQHGGRDDVVKVVDFGLVKKIAGGGLELTGVNTLLGSPLYMAPEAVTAPESYDGRGDLYCLGLVGYFLLIGEPPFGGDNAIDVLSAQIHEAPTPPSGRTARSIPAELDALIMDLLAKSPDARPRSAEVVVERLASMDLASQWTAERAARWWRTHGERDIVRERYTGVLELSSTNLAPERAYRRDRTFSAAL